MTRSASAASGSSSPISTRRSASSTSSSGALHEQSLKLAELGGGNVGHRCEAQPVAAPFANPEAILLECSVGGFFGGPYEQVHRVKAPVIDDRCDGRAAE